MVSHLDGEASREDEERLGRHLDGCEACRVERASVERLAHAIQAFGAPVSVSPTLEDALVRRVRALEAEGPAPWRERLGGWLPIPILAAAAAAVLVVVGLRTEQPSGIPAPVAESAPVRVATAPVRRDPGPARGETAPVASDGSAAPTTRRLPEDRVVAEAAPGRPPDEMLAELPLLLDLPILRNMEKLEHYDSIEALTAIDDEESSG